MRGESEAIQMDNVCRLRIVKAVVVFGNHATGSLQVFFSNKLFLAGRSALGISITTRNMINVACFGRDGLFIGDARFWNGNGDIS